MSIESVRPSHHLIRVYISMVEHLTATISSSVAPFSSCVQSFPASGSFQVSWLLASGRQSIGASTSASVFPMNTQGWSPSGLTGLISLLSKGAGLKPYPACQPEDRRAQSCPVAEVRTGGFLRHPLSEPLHFTTQESQATGQGLASKKHLTWTSLP